MNEQPPPIGFRQRALALGPVILVAAVIFCRLSYTVADPDLWGHVRFGQDTWKAGTIIDSDPYSYLGDQKWTNHEWLCEVIFAALFDGLGTPGLTGFKAATVLVIFGLLYRHLRQQGGTPLRACIVLLCVAFLMVPGLGTFRPHLFTYVGFLLMLLVIQAASRGRIKQLWLAAPLVAIWVNLHGGVLAGIGILIIWASSHLAIEAWWRGLAWPSTRQIVLASLIGVAACMASPYGWELPFFLLRTATVPRPEISEWAPINVTSSVGLMYLLATTCGTLALCGSRRPRDPALVVTFICTVVLPLAAARHLPLFALSCAVCCGEHLFDVWERNSPATIERARRGPLPIAMGCFVYCGAAVFALLAIPNLSCIHIVPEHFSFPSRAVAFMKHHEYRGNLAVVFDWGEYVIWYLGPDVKVSMDGRRETVYSEKIRAQNLEWIQGVGRWDAILDDYPTDMALVDKKLPVYNLMKLKSGWSLEYQDQTSALFVREHSRKEAITAAEVARVPADGKGLCFP